MKKRIEVMGVVNNGGNVVRKIVGFELDANDYVKVASGDKVKEMIKDYVKELKLFGIGDIEKLNFQWNDFLEQWRKERRRYLDDQKKKSKEKDMKTLGLTERDLWEMELEDIEKEIRRLEKRKEVLKGLLE